MARKPFHAELSEEVQKRARAMLRKQLRECKDWRTDDTAADAVIEQVWNVIAGHDKIKPPRINS